MDISLTPKRKDDINHAPVPQAEEEHDTEITVIVTPPAASLKPILKHSNTSLLSESQSPQKIPATTNEIRAAMTSSPSSPDCPEHKYSTQETPGDNIKAGDHTDADKHTTKPRTRRVKRTLTCEFNQMAKPSHPKDNPSIDNQNRHNELLRESQDADWLYTNQQLNEIAITNPDTSQKCITIFSAINLKKKRKMLFAPNGLQ